MSQNSSGASGEQESQSTSKPVPEWWQTPGMPFRQKPRRWDYICMFGIIGAGVYALALRPFWPWLLANNPYLLIVLNGSVTGIVRIGAEIQRGEQWWPLVLVIAAASTIKFDWLFWLAGRLWGEGLIEWMMGGASRGTGWLSRFRNKTAWWTHRLAQRWAIPMILLTYVPVVPIPSAIVFGALGMGRMRLRTFLIIDFVCALVNRSIYLYLGYRIGEPVLGALEVLNKYSLWLGIGLAVVIFIFAFRNGMKSQSQVSDADVAADAEQDTGPGQDAGPGEISSDTRPGDAEGKAS